THTHTHTQEALVCVHGFGGNADHWRKNIGALGKHHRVFAIDLLGYGFSDKPDPRLAPTNSIYNFEVWGAQLVDFIQEIVQKPSFIITNSVGGLAGLEAGIAREDLVKGVQLMDISLRGLNFRRIPQWQHPFLRAFQRLLRESALGAAFFSSIAKPQAVRNVLTQAYGRKEAVTDELVDAILKPGLAPGAVDVFLDFISYSGGPLPEDLLSTISSKSVPVSILWGEEDPWEDINLGRKFFAHLPSVKEFIPLPGVGHCPMDEAPETVNDLILKFVNDYK
ncbi:Alpha/Beta hydrolase protein, partial [Dunaliella salina]